MTPKPMTPKTIKTAAMVLQSAKITLHASKWVNQPPCTWHGEHCTITPLDEFALSGVADAVRLAKCVLLTCANEVTKTYYGSIPEWNDRPERTVDQVHKAYDMAIERLNNAEPV